MDKRSYFLWDYDLTEGDVHKILREGDETTRLWLVARIIESAHFDDVWKYINLNELSEIFPKLRLKKPIKLAWERALDVWQTV